MRKIYLSLILILFFNSVSIAVNFYWVGGTGNWSDYLTHWATSSGGSTFHIAPPGPLDDVYFDANSFSTSGNIVTVDQSNVYCKNFMWQGTINGSVFKVLYNNKISVFGSLNIDLSATINNAGKISLESPNSGNTVLIQDTLPGTLEFNSLTGVWDLAAPLKSADYINLISGTLNTNNYNVAFRNFKSDYGTNGRTFNTGTTTFGVLGEYGTGTMANSYWKIDNTLLFDGSNNDFILTPSNTLDTNSLMTSSFTDIFDFFSGNQHYRNFYASAIGNYGSYLLTVILDFNVQSCYFKSIILNNVTFIDITSSTLGGPGFTSLTIDSIISTGVTSASDIIIHAGDTLIIGVIKSDEKVEIQPKRYSSIQSIYSGGLVRLYTYGTLPSAVVNSNYFGTVYSGGNFEENNFASIGHNPFTIGKCVIKGDGLFHSKCVFDTLLFSPGHVYTIDAGDTIITNNEFIAHGLPASTIQIHSATTGNQAKFIFNQNDVCSDYLVLRDMNAIGTNVNAGANSIDLANNTGWQFTPCSITSNVWPGDANYDLTVDNTDILYVGIAFGDTGSVRTGASTNYIAQPASHWNGYFNSAVNKKHADCDGNGMVSYADTSAISLNYGLNHPARLANNILTNGNGYEISFQVPTGNVSAGSLVSIPILLGTSILPVDSIYGIALTVLYDPSFIVPGSISIDYSSSWMASAGNILHFDKDFSSIGKLDMAISRINHTNISGYGTIATLNFIVANNGIGFTTLSFGNIHGLTFQEYNVPIIGQSSSISTGIKNLSGSGSSFLFPNPVHENAELIFSNADHQNYSLEIVNVQGKVIKKIENISSDKMIFSCKELSSTIYFYSLKNEDETKVMKGKFIVQ